MTSTLETPISWLIEAWGLEKGRDLFAYRLDTANGLPEKLRRFFKNMPDNVTIRGVDTKNWDQEVAHIAASSRTRPRGW